MNEEAAIYSDTAAEEMEILIGQREIEIAGETITVREYTFVEGLRVDAIACRLKTELSELFVGGEDGPELVFDLNRLDAVLGENADEFIQLQSMASGRSVAWVEGLNNADGQLLKMTWWMVNQHFFVNRLTQGYLVRRELMKRVSQLDGRKPAPDSSGTDTAGQA